MPSSLVFVALVVAWLVVLVPMIARRRQAVTRTGDRELAARVVRRPHRRRRADMGAEVGEEVGYEVGDIDTRHDTGCGSAGTDDEGAPVGSAPDPPPGEGARPARPARRVGDDGRDPAPLVHRPYRAGRGGFDPEAAALAARARYGFRQRVMIGLLAVAGVSAIGAAIVTPAMWPVHVVADVLIATYLIYLRRQVRIEADVRKRRAARLADVHTPAVHTPARPAWEQEGATEPLTPVVEPFAPAVEPFAPAREPGIEPAPEPVRPAGTLVVDSDDDPAFHPLADQRLPAYRRAAGE